MSNVNTLHHLSLGPEASETTEKTIVMGGDEQWEVN